MGSSLTGSVVSGESMGSKSTVFTGPIEDIWWDTKTKGNITKTVRVLRIHALKQTSNATNRFLGPSSKIMSMAFTLKTFPSSLKALQIPLPAALGQTTEGLFVKTSKGKKVLSVQFGRGDMEEQTLVQNSMAALSAVHQSMDTHLVRDIAMDVDTLSLPVWNRKLWDRGKRKCSCKLRVAQKISKRGSMGPPIGLPLKRKDKSKHSCSSGMRA